MVTGGRGFIGTHLVQHLIATQNETVLSADVLPVEPTDRQGQRIDTQIDIRDVDKLREIFTHFDISTVFDLASIAEVNLSSREYLANIEMTRSMVECVLQFDVKKYLFYSTQLVFRKEGALPTGDQDYYPIDAYGESKMKSEQWIRRLMPENRWLILRPTYVWGEGNQRFRDGFLYRLAKGQLLLPATRGLVRHYGYVRTVCEQTAKLADYPFADLPSRTFYLSDKPLSMLELCGHFTAALGQGRVRTVPSAFLRSLGRLGEAAGALGLSFPINKLQADEMTRHYPVPIEETLGLTGASTDYRNAAAAVVAWALTDPDFRRRVGRSGDGAR